MRTTYIIPSERVPAFEKRIGQLRRKASKLGCPEITCERLGDYWTRYVLEHGLCQIHTYVAFECGTEAPSFDGWTLAAKIENGAWLGDADGAIVKRVPGSPELPEAFRDHSAIDPQHCDHCAASRRRKDTFVVRHDTGACKQVGRQCIRDFLGHDSPEKIASRYDFSLELHGELSEFCSGGQAIELADYAEFLAYVFKCIRMGGFTSASTAKRRSETAATGCEVLSTADEAASAMRARPQSRGYWTPETKDFKDALAALEWAPALTEQSSDFAQNMRAALAGAGVSIRTQGTVAYLAEAYRNRNGRPDRAGKAPSAHVGAVKSRVELTLTLDHETGWDGTYGWTRLYKFSDVAGNVITWKTGSKFRDESGEAIEVGDTLDVKATIKAHSNYQGTAQTAITRVTATCSARKPARCA